jgi:formate dehydrogenase
MMVLSLVRNYLPSHEYAVKGGWNIADCVSRSYDVEGMHFGTVAAGHIGIAVLRQLQPFGLHLHYTDPHRLSEKVETELGLTYHPDAVSLVKAVDIVNLQMPLYPSTEHFFDDRMFAHMKRGTYLVNTARGKLVDRDAVVRALESGQLAGYATCPGRSSVAEDALQWHDPSYFRHLPVGAGPLRRGNTRDPAKLLRG